MLKRKTLPAAPLTEAQSQLVADHYYLALRVARGMWRRCQEAVPLEDLRYHAVLGLVAAARLYDPARGYVFATLAWHCALNRMRQYLDYRHLRRRVYSAIPFSQAGFTRWRPCNDEPEDDDLWQPATVEHDYVHTADVAERLERVRRLLPARWWQVLVWRFRDGMTHQEIAEREQCSHQRVHQLVERALRRVRKALPQEVSA